MAENEGEAANGRADVAASAHQSDMPVPSMEPAPSGVQMPSLSSQADAQGMEGTGDMGDASSQGGMPHPDMEEGLTQRGTQGESMEGIGLKRVLVEVRIPRSENASFALETAGQLNVPGFRLDSDYQPVPATPTREHAAQLRDADEQAVLVRGEIEESRIPELEAQPDVIRVWLDTPIAPFSAEVEAPPIELGEEEAPHLRQLNMAVGPCPIPPCDCQPSVAKGTIGDVAQYLGADQIWALGRRGLGITVGVVDGGITADGRPVKPGETSRRIPRVTGGWPTADWGTEASDWGEHGNMCSTDVLGMAPEAEIYDIRIAGVGTAATISNALAGFQWAIDQHQATGRPHILSNSWGIFQEAWDPDYATNPNHPFTRKVVEALNEGILILFAAGNCGGADCADGRCGSDTGPGRDIWGSNGHPRVMTVGAVNINEQFIGYSSRGPAALDPNKPDFCSISHFQGYFGSDSGTSAATPIAAGVVALLKQSNPSISQEQLKIALRGTARDIGPAGWDQHTGAGILRGAAAYNSLSLGRLEVFARGGDHSLWHIWQTAPNDGWSSWASLGGWIDAPTVTRNTDGRLEAFVIGADHALWHIWQTTPGGGWSSWASLGGVIDMIEVGQNADGRLEVFARGMNGALWHIWQTTPGGGWSSWASLGGLIDMIEVGQNADGRLEAFARGTDGALWHIWQTAPNDGWSSWASLGGGIDGIAVGQNADGRLEAFVRGMVDRALWHIWQTAPNDGWSSWASLGGWIDAPTVTRNTDGRLEAFVIGANNALWHIWQTTPGGGWSSWASLGGWIDMTEVGQNADGRLEVFACGGNGGLWHIWQTTPGGGWSSWASLGGWIDQMAVGANVS